jgi:hypothetical protein
MVAKNVFIFYDKYLLVEKYQCRVMCLIISQRKKLKPGDRLVTIREKQKWMGQRGE